MQEIDWGARREAIDGETVKLGRERDTPWQRRLHKFRRFGIRTLRVAFGLAWGCIGAIVISNAPEVSDIPLASMTLGTILKSAGCWVIGGWIIYTAFRAAFGAGPSRQEREEALVRDATTNVDQRASLLGGRYG